MQRCGWELVNAVVVADGRAIKIEYPAKAALTVFCYGQRVVVPSSRLIEAPSFSPEPTAENKSFIIRVCPLGRAESCRSALRNCATSAKQ